MKVVQNINQSYCNCDFDWVVVDELNNSVFGSNVKEDCENYIKNFPI